jgi:hypothetical protein
MVALLRPVQELVLTYIKPFDVMNPSFSTSFSDNSNSGFCFNTVIACFQPSLSFYLPATIRRRCFWHLSLTLHCRFSSCSLVLSCLISDNSVSIVLYRLYLYITRRGDTHKWVESLHRRVFPKKID